MYINTMSKYVSSLAIRNTDAPPPNQGYLFTDNNSSQQSLVEDYQNKGWSIFAMVLLMLAIACVNALMCMAIHKTPTARFVTNILTLNLGVCDLGVALLCIPMSLGVMNGPYADQFPWGFCQLVAFITVTLLLVSVGTLAAISLDRYYSICHALRYPIEMTGRRGYYVLCFIWTESVIFASMPLFGWGKYEMTDVSMCLPQWSSSVSYAVFTVLLGIVLPFCCMLFSYSCIVQEARKQAQRIVKLQLTPSCEVMNSSDDKDHLVPNARRLSVLASKWRRTSVTSTVSALQYSTTSHNLKTLSTVFIIVGTFLICWCPYVSVNVWSVLHGSRTLPYGVHFCVVVLVLSSCVFNPCVFMLLTRDLRHTAFHLLLRLVLCRKQSSAALCGAYCSGRRASGMDTINIHSRDSRPSMDSGVDIELMQQRQPLTSCTDPGNSNLLAPPPSPAACGQTVPQNTAILSYREPISRQVVAPKSLSIPTIVVQAQTDY